jgi:hypothetical protein
MMFKPNFADPAQSSTIPLRVLSLGACVHSTTMAPIAASGEIGRMPDCAIFASTGLEPGAVDIAKPHFEAWQTKRGDDVRLISRPDFMIGFGNRVN